MPIVNIRIDDRLIHGQVATAWSKAVAAERIMVVDNAVVKDTINKEALKLACPQQCKLSILTAQRAAENILAGNYDAEKLFIIVKNPRTLCEMYDFGFRFDKVNVGNMGGQANTRMLAKAVSVNDVDVASFKELLEHGVTITSQMVPADDVLDFGEIIRKNG